MSELWKDDGFCVTKEKILPVSIKEAQNVGDVEELLCQKNTCVSFAVAHCAKFEARGAFVVLDFGKELCGGLRFITRTVEGNTAMFRITFGESLSEAYSFIGEKNACNDHSPRDFEVMLSNMSDLTFGQSGFRFARVELLSDKPVCMKNIYAVNTLPVFEKEGFVTTSDSKLNQIIETAAYTLKLNFQNGYIWDGIKRDRLVWSGDLHQEIITSIYLYGDNENIRKSLSFLQEETPEDKWINHIPSYSAWWVISLCDYCRLVGNSVYFKQHKKYAEAILRKIDACIDDTGNMVFEDSGMPFYLDWPTFGTQDAVIGTASLMIYAANSFLKMEENYNCHSIIRKLKKYLDEPCNFKQTRAFQILAGRRSEGDQVFLEKEGAKGFSTFMSYYILTADALAGGKGMLSIIKEYYGAMLCRGATTFWEDFHMDWLDGSGRIDELPKEGQKDIHGDYGTFCYQGFRHSLCHGWACGVLAFIIEYMLGLQLKGDSQTYEVVPCTLGVKKMHAKLPLKRDWLLIDVMEHFNHASPDCVTGIL